MNIYIQELRSLFKNTLIWTISIIGLIIFLFALYPGLAKDADQFMLILKNYPPEVLSALGATIDLVTSINGYYAFCLVYINLCAAIQAMKFGVDVLAKESSRKTCDFIFVKPVSRIKVLISKLAAAITSFVITDIFIIPIAIISATMVETKAFDMKVFLLISISILFIQLIFAALGFFCAAIAKKIKGTTAVSLGTVMAFFTISLIVNAFGDDKLKYISFLTYLSPNYIIEHGHFEFRMLICAVAAIVFLIAISFFYYNKKDIHSA